MTITFILCCVIWAAATFGSGRCKRSGERVWSEREGLQFPYAICLSCATYAAKSSRKDL